jgi:hypothetical protein
VSMRAAVFGRHGASGHLDVFLLLKKRREGRRRQCAKSKMYAIS